MTELIDPEQAAKKDTRRAWKFVVAAFVVVFGLFVGVMLFYDCPPPDDSSIMPKFTESPGGYNPLAVFLEEVKDNPLGDVHKELSLEARARENGSEEEIRTYLAKQTLPFQAFDKLIQTDPSTWRWPGGAERVSIHFKSGDVMLCQSMGNALNMKVHLEAGDGKLDAAVKTSLQLIKFGHGLEGSEGTTIDSLVAMTGSALGKQALEQALICEKATLAMLTIIQQEVASLEPRRQDSIMTTKVEALYGKKAVETIKNRDPALAGRLDGIRGILIIFLKPNLNQASAIYYTKPIVDGMTVSWSEGWAAAQMMKLEYETFTKNWFRFWISPNVYGNYIMKLTLPQVIKIQGRVLINVATTRLTVLMLAMRRYELEQGKLPNALEELVPKYLSAVPLDPFDDAPMRWNPEKKVLYSVGEDGKDDGGKIDPVRRKRGQTFNTHYDVSMIYWWSDEATRARNTK